ncbi:fatty acid desaturase 6 [Lingula anatina]|uniref:Fatty acid desaturase 6 n=1 Tax=Lingula anatina TaxID=7574 RepID=A0A1S3K0I7_LINAN|nr:fatty acid desaturase 6 [Lingula anatina]|eukprot:XP_013415879.1 fatty acid desaturase 6 [Lingula anatina]
MAAANGQITSYSDYQEVFVKLRELPNYADLKRKVDDVVKNSSWWDLYGVDWMITLCGFACLPVGWLLLRSYNPILFLLGMFIVGCVHALLANKCGHLVVHNAMCVSKKWGVFWRIFFGELCGSFSDEMGMEIHVKIHHPHTNIIGLGDSSSWRAPFLPCYIYMFLAPLALPALTPFISLVLLWGRWLKILRWLPVMTAGLVINAYILVHVSGFTWTGALWCMCVSRAVLAIPYIHVNIFQHIGLPMYDRKHRPKRIYQMSTGVLNLSRNLILDYCFGHSLISCHVEHHLFNRLSDNMCLKIKPLVKQFLKDNGLPYQEADYMERVNFFVSKYDDLMVKLPPVIHFVGIQ